MSKPLELRKVKIISLNYPASQISLINKPHVRTSSNSKASQRIQDSPYAQSQIFVHSRSHSSAKKSDFLLRKLCNPSPTNISGLRLRQSSDQSVKIPLKQILDRKQNSSSKLRINFKLIKPIASYKRLSLAEEARQLEETLTEKLSRNPESLETYAWCFGEITQKAKSYEKLLYKIKSSFELRLSQIQARSLFKINEQLEQDLARLERAAEEEEEHRNILERRIEKLTRENTELAISIEGKEEKYIDIQDQFFKISRMNLDKLTKDQQQYESLKQGNQNYSSLCKDLRKDNKQHRHSEKQLLKALHYLRKQGIPVEDIYEADVQQKKKKRRLPKNSLSAEDNTENENITDSVPLPFQKPPEVPGLHLAAVSPDLSSSSNSSLSPTVHKIQSV